MMMMMVQISFCLLLLFVFNLYSIWISFHFIRCLNEHLVIYSIQWCIVASMDCNLIGATSGTLSEETAACVVWHQPQVRLTMKCWDNVSMLFCHPLISDLCRCVCVCYFSGDERCTFSQCLLLNSIFRYIVIGTWMMPNEVVALRSRKFVFVVGQHPKNQQTHNRLNQYKSTWIHTKRVYISNL